MKKAASFHWCLGQDAWNAYAIEGQPTAESAVALIREWRALEIACR
jgi:hypothetical protein